MVRKPVHRDPLAERVAEDVEKSPDRRRKAALVAVGGAGALLGWFALANLRNVRIDFWVFDRQAPLILVIVISGLLGALITALVMRRKGRD